jgi:predicted ATPase
VLEAESQGAVEHLAGAVPSSTLAVPASLQASLMARLDRLGPAKEVAQIGAAIGREFSHALMAAVTHKAEVELQSALDRLMAAGLLFRQGAPPHATYLFKHALVRDAAYGTLLREPRRALHASIGISAKSAASWVEVEVCASTASSLSSFACAVSSCTSPAARSIWLTIG